jgi:cellulose synthase/poly-beta-1,6-N-acetylglucosamine synthase-like glycosyltransferase
MVLALFTFFFLITYACLIFYYHYHWLQLPNFVAGKKEPHTQVSVIIAARNEEKTLPVLLTALAAQTYPQRLFEVIVVDDFSTDNTWQVAKEFTNVQLTRPAADAARSSKKKAIETGVEKAKGNLMLITDADCLPAPEWIETMVSFYEQKEAAFIAAPVKFSYNQSLLQLFQALDFMTLQGITAASVQANIHTMCNGANLAYTKSAFNSVGGFKGIDKVASGDDMLLMHKIWKENKKSVWYLKNKDAIVTTQPMKTWKEFLNQRRRWASKTAYYDDKRIMAVLFFIYLFNWFFIVLLIAVIFKFSYWPLLVAYLVFKIVIETIFVRSVASFYGEGKLLVYFPFLQPLHILYTVSIGIISQLGKYEWKSRKTK